MSSGYPFRAAGAVQVDGGTPPNPQHPDSLPAATGSRNTSTPTASCRTRRISWPCRWAARGWDTLWLVGSGGSPAQQCTVLTLCCEFACLSGCARWLCRAQPWPDATCVPGCAGWLGCARLGRHWVFLEQQNPLCAGQVGRKSCPWEGGGQGVAAACTLSAHLTSLAGPIAMGPAPHHGAVGSTPILHWGPCMEGFLHGSSLAWECLHEGVPAWGLFMGASLHGGSSA